MKILSLNAWHGTRDRELRDFLTEHIASTDIFCFQESDGEAIRQIFADLFPREMFQELSSIKTSCTTPDSLTTFVRQGIEIVKTDVLFADNANEAGYSYITQIRHNGVIVTVANTHGVPYPGDKLDTPGRIMQSKVIIDTLSAYDGSKIVCGDFNLDPSTESVHLFNQAGYTNLIHEYHIPTTRNDLAWSRFPDRKQLFADYVFVSSADIVHDFSVPNNLVSDHLPLIIEINDNELLEKSSSDNHRAELSIV